MRAQAAAAKLIKEAKLIVWDEAPMTHKRAFEMVDQLLREIMSHGEGGEWRQNTPFGGKTVVFLGDFRQVLPVVPRGSRAAIVDSSLKRSKLWRDMTVRGVDIEIRTVFELWSYNKYGIIMIAQVMELKVNMRVKRMEGSDPAAATRLQQFAADLLNIGDGKAGAPYLIPPNMCLGGSQRYDLIRDIYGDFSVEANRSPERLIERCILTPKNDDVFAINEETTKLWPAPGPRDSKTYVSADYTKSDDDQAAFPPEMLNSLNPQGLPPHKLELKVGIPVILLRNLDPKRGLANGTRLIITELRSKLLKAKILSGTFKDTEVLIPRIPLAPSDSKLLPVKFTRRQFPIRPAFAMTINKSQGQTFAKVGIFLPKPVFSHGQLYVAMSRVGSPEGIKFLVLGHQQPPGLPAGVYTDNVVYSEVYRD